VFGGGYRTRQLLHTSNCALIFFFVLQHNPTNHIVCVRDHCNLWIHRRHKACKYPRSFIQRKRRKRLVLDVKITDDQGSVMDTSRTEIQSIDTQPVDFEERPRDTLATGDSEISTDTNSVHFDGRPRYTCATRDQAISTGSPPRPPPRSERERERARVSVQIQELSETS
jgi:hypothetical protein